MSIGGGVNVGGGMSGWRCDNKNGWRCDNK